MPMTTRGDNVMFSKYTKVVRSTLLVLTCIISVSQISEGEEEELIDRHVTSFAAEKVNVGNIIGRITSVLAVPVGFEGTATDPPKKITVVVNDTNVNGLLDAIVREDPQYSWTVADKSIINIYPRNSNERFLDRVIPKFTVQGKTRMQALQELTETPAFAALLHELHANLHTMISGPPNLYELGPKIDIDLRDASIREVLNKIVIASRGRGWTAVRYGSHLQYLSLSVG
jgi:hypothetical protein